MLVNNYFQIWLADSTATSQSEAMLEHPCYMMTSSNGNIFRVTGHLCGEFTGPRWIPRQRPVTRSFHVFFDLHPNKLLSKQWWGWWFETPSCPLWRHSNRLTCMLTRVLLSNPGPWKNDNIINDWNNGARSVLQGEDVTNLKWGGVLLARLVPDPKQSTV